MDNMSLIHKLPLMLSGSELEQALTILPEYDPCIKNENAAVRLLIFIAIFCAKCWLVFMWLEKA